MALLCIFTELSYYPFVKFVLVIRNSNSFLCSQVYVYALIPVILARYCPQGVFLHSSQARGIIRQCASWHIGPTTLSIVNPFSEKITICLSKVFLGVPLSFRRELCAVPSFVILSFFPYSLMPISFSFLSESRDSL